MSASSAPKVSRRVRGDVWIFIIDSRERTIEAAGDDEPGTGGSI
jgi:hypothetical protein